MDKKKLAERIIAHVGGKGNIENVFHLHDVTAALQSEGSRDCLNPI